MKRNVLFSPGLIAPAVLAACVTSHAGVYSSGIYSAGTTYYGVCSTALPFAPYQYDLTEISWREDSHGHYIMGIENKWSLSDTQRRCLEVATSSEKFILPLDSGPVRFKGTNDPPAIIGSGDFAAVLTQSLTNRGGRLSTNAFPVIQTNWVCGSNTKEDVFILMGDHFTEVQNLLERACGKPDETIHSSNGAGGNCRSINYTPAQIGVFLNLTRTFDEATIVAIVGKQKPKRSNPSRQP